MTLNLAGRPLTEAELTILRQAAQGLTYAQIGREMGYQEKSIAKMALRAARKLEARSITHAVHLATLTGVLFTRSDCGTRATYLRHLRRSEPACPACREANAAHAARQRAGQLKDAA